MKKISNNVFLCPMPMTIVSAEVTGRINHLAIAWITRVNGNPPMIAMGLNRAHHTNGGIRATGELGVSVPSTRLMAATDHAGLVSGAHHDKSQLFEVFYGGLAHAPMVVGCPLTLACRLHKAVDLPTHDLFIAEVVEAYCAEDALTEGHPDVEKMKLFSLTMPDNRYWALGDCLGAAWSIGRDFR